MHVLVLEPDAIQANNCRKALEAHGHSVDLARSAQAAVHMADTKQPDAVVLELQLPRHNGVEFLYEFRSYPEWLHIPIVLYTFTPLSELADKPTLTRELGVTRILYKPDSSLAALCEAVRSVATPVAP